MKLTKKITETEFDNGYWYSDEIKAFAREIGIKYIGKLRKDELEQLIKYYIRNGRVKKSDRKNVVKRGKKDIEIGLTASLPVINYTSNKQTTDFIKTEADKLVRGLKIKSGVWYRLNRWRDRQITNGKRITYGDLINQFIILNQTEGKFEKVDVGRYINFISDYLANEKRATRQQAIDEWKKLKKLNAEKSYKSWKQLRKNIRPNR
ncbi:hypothetical protein JXL83_02295 [candidate division WOR-3 bacterium]|nr:hypothetical protein [candidate division WOR-3 bacterium]